MYIPSHINMDDHKSNSLSKYSLFSNFASTNIKSMVDPGLFNRGFKISEGVGIDPVTLRKVWANNIDPDQTPQNAASDQGRYCLPLIQQL